MQGIHPEQPCHARDYDVEQMLEVVVRASDEKERRNRYERGEQHRGERQGTEYQNDDLQQAQA